MKCLAGTKGSAASLLVEKEKVEFVEVLKSRTTPGEKSATTSSEQAAISRPQVCSQSGAHNKENRGEKNSQDVPSDDELITSGSSLAEDSGYLSLHNSQIDSETSASLDRCPEQRDSTGSTDDHSDSNDSFFCLPVLNFQEDVCKELAKCYRKSQSYDFTIVDHLAEKYGLHNVIGGKMGLEHVDILCGLLKRNMKHILTRILSMLGDSDLISCKKVSKTWQSVICQDERALRRCRNAEKMLRDSSRSMGTLTRDFSLSRVVFSCLQTVASSTPVSKPTKKTLTHTDSALATPKPSRIAEFHEASKSLKSHERLICCRRCNSPARLDSAMQRATCMRVSCAFDFCSKCQSPYHGSTLCQRGVIRSSSRQHNVVAGSARSKRNIHRL